MIDEIKKLSFEEPFFVGSNLLDIQNKLESDLHDLVSRYSKRTTKICTGTTRIVFIFDKYVVKIPLNGEGFRANYWEGSVTNLFGLGIEARTRLVFWKNIPVLFMERVAPLSYEQIKLLVNKKDYGWIDFIDGRQIGLNRKDKVVAYDYGDK